MLRRIARGMLRIFRWRVEGEVPDLPKMVIIGGPHTSNWDFALAMLAAPSLGLRIKWLGKHTLFRKPFAWFFRMLGGIPVDRARASGVIGQSTEAFAERDELILVLTPEGTRSKQSHWKSGFYHIAKSAQVPVLLVGVDGPTRRIVIGPHRTPDDDVDAYMDWVRGFYADYRGVRPENVGEIRLKSEDNE